MTEFHDATFQEIYIIDCVFGEKALNCRGGEIDGQYYSLWFWYLTKIPFFQFKFCQSKDRHQLTPFSVDVFVSRLKIYNFCIRVAM